MPLDESFGLVTPALGESNDFIPRALDVTPVVADLDSHVPGTDQVVVDQPFYPGNGDRRTLVVGEQGQLERLRYPSGLNDLLKATGGCGHPIHRDQFSRGRVI